MIPNNENCKSSDSKINVTVAIITKYNVMVLLWEEHDRKVQEQQQFFF